MLVSGFGWLCNCDRLKLCDRVLVALSLNLVPGSGIALRLMLQPIKWHIGDGSFHAEVVGQATHILDLDAKKLAKDPANDSMDDDEAAALKAEATDPQAIHADVDFDLEGELAAQLGQLEADYSEDELADEAAVAEGAAPSDAARLAAPDDRWASVAAD